MSLSSGRFQCRYIQYEVARVNTSYVIVNRRYSLRSSPIRALASTRVTEPVD